MYQAIQRRDTGFDGIFFTGVTSTGIFCRPTCPARTPSPENVEFYPTARDALFAGFRPCLRCRPLEPAGQAPTWLRPLIDQIEAAPQRRWTDDDLRERGVEPERVRRWFKGHYGMTFHAYQRGVRLGRAFAQLREGAPIAQTAFESGYESLSGFNDAFRQIAGDVPTASRGMDVVHMTRILTPLGPMIAGATEEGLCLLEFSDRRMLELQLRRVGRLFGLPMVPGRHEVLDRIETELADYFAGILQDFTVPLVVPGSEFQRSVWDMLQTIPYGETRSYAEQAVAIGRPTAVRAVARANGDNRIAIVIPCHRVVGSDGKLTGYGGGLWRKQFLLDLEQNRRAT
jgi:AraC family transcriptional regulator, regulatory protein of adaptative response / methylated-DNA-[protein]-cysteine methyltransferase